MAEEIPVWGYELKDFINIGTDSSANWQEVTNLLSWDMEGDQETYEPDYINTKAKPTFVLGTSANIEYEKDMYKNNAFDEFLFEHRNDTNIPCEVMRVYTWDVNSGKMTAEKAKYLLTPKALDKNASGEPIKLKGTLSMKDEGWTSGTWNGSAFTAE